MKSPRTVAVVFLLPVSNVIRPLAFFGLLKVRLIGLASEPLTFTEKILFFFQFKNWKKL